MHAATTALYTAAQVRAIDAGAIAQLGVPGFTLMGRAAAAALQVLRRRWPQARRIVVLCGPGNNGGDGLLLAAQAQAQGYVAEVVAVGAAWRGDAALARDAFAEWSGVVHQVGSIAHLPPADVYVDALFGSGLDRAIDGPVADLISWVNASDVPVLALDIPSGLDADTGRVPGAAIRAEATASFVAWKRGLFTAQAGDFCGALSLHHLAVPEAAYAPFAADAQLLQIVALPSRQRDSNKGNYGHVLAMGGDFGMAGAVRLCAESALRCGAGLVSVATRAAHIGAINAARPELMAHAVENVDALQPMLRRASVLALGPGLGQADWGKLVWRTALDTGKPVVMDADALNLLAKQPRALPARAVLTPHPGEAARLLDTDVATVQADRFAAVRALAANTQAVAVLKGSGSLIARPDGEVAVCPWGNPGMASGGMGDVLTGVIAALLAQGQSPWQAACLGVSLHARAGDMAARDGQRGLLASDLFVPLRHLLDADEHG